MGAGTGDRVFRPAELEELAATFADRLPTRRAMIDKYLAGKLPTLDQIAFQPEKPGMLDKIKAALKIDGDRKKAGRDCRRARS